MPSAKPQASITGLKSARDVTQVVKGSETSDGAGVRLHRLIGSPELNMLDPFLLLDAFRSDDPDDYIAGFPTHPHRGFETVTYQLAGRMRHRDSSGHEGILGAGGVQWMTAGRGIEHSEMPEQENGLLAGFQLWVNLPAAKKMTAPRYQEFDAELIPVEERDGNSSIRVIAGTTDRGTTGPVKDIAADPIYLDVSVKAGAGFEESIPHSHNAFLYLIEGSVTVLGANRQTRIDPETLAVLMHGDSVAVVAESDSRFLLIAGRPFNEPVARWGPFVMNTREEIQQAIEDQRNGHITDRGDGNGEEA